MKNPRRQLPTKHLADQDVPGLSCDRPISLSQFAEPQPDTTVKRTPIQEVASLGESRLLAWLEVGQAT
jgi:hypothetical protein